MPQDIKAFWRNEIESDIRIIGHYLQEAECSYTDGLKEQYIALALKEITRLKSDIYRMSAEVWKIDKHTIDAVQP